jgi:hypothetical protein
MKLDRLVEELGAAEKNSFARLISAVDRAVEALKDALERTPSELVSPLWNQTFDELIALQRLQLRLRQELER